MTGECQGSLCLWHGSEERLFLLIYYKKYFYSKKCLPHVDSAGRCSWGAGYGIMSTPLSVVLSPPQQKDVSYVAPPTRHRAGAGRHRPRGPGGFSQRPSLSDAP